MNLTDNFESVRARIERARERSSAPTRAVTLVAVSKRQPTDRIQSYLNYCAEHELKAVLGENYLQEYDEKRLGLEGKVRVHMIGALQRNKAKRAVELFDLIEAVHTEKLAKELQKQAKKLDAIQECFLQVNISDDGAKSGFSKDAVKKFLRDNLAEVSHLSILGLMTITQFYDDPEGARPDFQAMHTLREECEQEFGRPFRLSMGMSADFEIAIEEGADVVRVGSALFGVREPRG